MNNLDKYNRNNNNRDKEIRNMSDIRVLQEEVSE